MGGKFHRGQGGLVWSRRPFLTGLAANGRWNQLGAINLFNQRRAALATETEIRRIKKAAGGARPCQARAAHAAKLVAGRIRKAAV